MSLRYVLAGALAGVITFALFLQMQALITMRGHGQEEVKGGRIIDFIRLKKESELQVKKRELPEKAPPAEPPPPLPEMDLSHASKPQQNLGGVVVPPPSDVPLEIAGGPSMAVAPSDTDVIPLVRVNPQYPIQAMERGIEGWVEVRFTISATGAVRNPEIIASEPGSIFNRAAIEAIRKWKYKPKIEDGVPVERPGVAVRLVFKLENG